MLFSLTERFYTPGFPYAWCQIGGSVHSWRCVKILTQRHLCENPNCTARDLSVHPLQLVHVFRKWYHHIAHVCPLSHYRPGAWTVQQRNLVSVRNTECLGKLASVFSAMFSPVVVFTLSDARSLSGLTSKIPPLGSTLNFDADVKKTTVRHLNHPAH